MKLDALSMHREILQVSNSRTDCGLFHDRGVVSSSYVLCVRFVVTEHCAETHQLNSYIHVKFEAFSQ